MSSFKKSQEIPIKLYLIPGLTVCYNRQHRKGNIKISPNFRKKNILKIDNIGPYLCTNVIQKYVPNTHNNKTKSIIIKKL